MAADGSRSAVLVVMMMELIMEQHVRMVCFRKGGCRLGEGIFVCSLKCNRTVGCTALACLALALACCRR